MMVQRFSGECRRVVSRAQEQARYLGHPFLGTEHLLLGVLDDPNGYPVAALRSAGVDTGDVRRQVLSMIGDPLDAEALTSLGIDLQRVREVTEVHFGVGALASTRWPAPIRGHLPVTRRAKTVLALSARAARRLGQQTITPEHLMLGILDDGGGVAIRALEGAHVDMSALRRDIAAFLERDAA
jgi:ATP-dependent Clp protease ATP-binding subunit ClpA